MDQIAAIAVLAVIGAMLALSIAGDQPGSMKSAGGEVMKQSIEKQQEALLP